MIDLVFGLPRSGKTTLYTAFALAESKRISRHKSRFKMIYGNVPLFGVPHYRCIPFEWLGKFDIRESLVLIDESGLLIDNRDYKDLKHHFRDFMMLHGHYKLHIIFFNQQWDGLDKKIRCITDRVFYIRKSRILPFISRYYRIPYDIIIPDKKSQSDKLGDIIQGYCKPPLLSRLFCKRLFRPRYYKYFDSFDAPKLPPLPKEAIAGPLEHSSFQSRPPEGAPKDSGTP